MSSPQFHREYLTRLPLPLAQLYSRAYNAKDGRGRHDNAFYLFEALIKLAGAPLVACYLTEVEHSAPRVPALDRLLAQLALPSLGQWVAILRELSRYYGARPDAASQPLGHVWDQLTAPRRELPALVALYRQIKNGPDAEPGGDQSCTILELLDKLVAYRNGVFGHGAARFDSFYSEQMGPLLFPAINDLLSEGVLDLLGPTGSRLVYLTELRTIDEGRVQVGLRELVGLEGERMSPLELETAQAASLLPNRVAVLWPGRLAPLRLDPLLQYRESDLAEEVLFLNRDRNGRQVEYLSYTTGRTERDKSMLPAMTALLSRVTNRAVTEADLERLTQQSIAETPSVEQLFDAPHVARQVGDYELLAEIGRGGMGVVYLARQLSLGRLVALKMLPADLAGDEVALARFRREIRHLARCEHPNIIKVLSSGTLPDGQLFYTMEYVPGSDLEMVWRELAGPNRQGSASTLGNSTWASAVLTASRKRREKAEKSSSGSKPAVPVSSPAESSNDLAGKNAYPTTLPLPPLPELPNAADDPGGYIRRVVTLIRDAALALQAVHDQGIVHRDVKPANLMLTPDSSRLVLMDFGLAKGESLAMSASRSAGFLGTLRYAAPEQLAAATLKVGPAADVRGLGVTLWEFLTRERLFGDAEDEVQLAHRVHEQDVPRLRAVDPNFDRDLEAIVARATERRTIDRIPSAGQLAEYLQFYLDGKPLPIRPPGSAELMRRWVRERRSLVSSVFAAVVVILAATVISFLRISAAKVQVEYANSKLLNKNAEMVLTQRNLQQQLAHNYIEQGVNHAERGGLAEAIVKFHQAYSSAVEDGQIRKSAINLMNGWEASLPYILKHDDDVIAVAFSSDGKVVVTGSRDKTARLWDAMTGKPRGAPMRHEGEVRAVVFSADGQTVLTGSLDAARLWDATTGKPRGAPMRHEEEEVRAVALSADGRTVLTGSSDTTACLWDATTGKRKPRGRLMGHDGDVQAVAFSVDGRTALTGSRDKTARLWDAATGKPQGAPMRHEGEVRAVAFSVDGRTVLTGSRDKIARLWDAATGDPLGEPMMHGEAVLAVALSADGRVALTGSFDTTARLWDATTGKLRGELMKHGSYVSAVAFGPDGQSVLTGSYDDTARLWNASIGNPLRESMKHDSCILAATYSADGHALLTGSRDKTARLWDSATGKPMGAIMEHTDEVHAVAFSPGGHSVLTASGNAVRLWDATTGKPMGAIMEHTGKVYAVAFSPGGHSVRTASDNAVRLWDATTGKPICEPIVHEKFVSCAAFSPDGKTLLTASLNVVRLWDATTGEPRGEPLNHEQLVAVAKFSPDGATVLTGSMSNVASLWSVATCKPCGEPMRDSGWDLSLVFSADGKTILARSRDDWTMVRLWDAATGLPRGQPLKHDKKVYAAVFSPDGRAVLTGSADNTARLWDAATGKPLRDPMKHDDEVKAVAFNSDGQAVLTVSGTDSVRLWDAATGKPCGKPMKHGHVITQVQLSPNGRTMLIRSVTGTSRLWDLRRPPDDASFLAAWVAVRTGLAHDESGVPQALSQDEWLENWRALELVGHDWLKQREETIRAARDHPPTGAAKSETPP